MEDQVLKYKEEIRLLKLLLNEEQVQREKIGIDFHGKKNGLIRLNHNCQQFSKGFEPDSPNVIFANKQIHDISDILKELESVQFNIYPRTIHLNGVSLGIERFVNSCKKKYSIEISLFDALDEEIKLSNTTEIGIYKTCSEIISYLCNSLANSLQIEIYYNKENFVFDIYSKRSESVKNNPELEKQIELIKAMIIWQDAMISENKNWLDRITVEFKIK